MSAQRKKDTLIWGAILIVVGLIFFLENFHVDVWDYVWKLWPAILIVWGAVKLLAGLREAKTPPPGTGDTAPRG
jgi:SNF family Na+-dependent transporter